MILKPIKDNEPGRVAVNGVTSSAASGSGSSGSPSVVNLRKKDDSCDVGLIGINKSS